MHSYLLNLSQKMHPVAPTPMPAHPAAHDTSATNRGSPGDIETLASWQIPTVQNWPELKGLLTGPTQRVIVLSPDKSFFAVAPNIMKKFLRTAQYTIAMRMGLNSHMAYFTLDPSDILTARSQTERARLFAAAPSAHSAVFVDGYYAVKPPILASLLACMGLRCQT